MFRRLLAVLFILFPLTAFAAFPPVQWQELDGSPSVFPTKILVPNNGIEAVTGSVVELDFAGGGAGGIETDPNAWLKLSDQTGLTGDKTGSFDINTSGTVTGTIVSVTDDLFVGDIFNRYNTQGVTINQGANDDEILSLKSSDISHSFTSVTEADTYGKITKGSGIYGGLTIEGFSDGDTDGALHLKGYIGLTNPTDSYPAMEFSAGKLSGTSRGKLGNAETAFQFKSFTTEIISILGNGNVGIGTTNPGGALDVVGSIKSSTTVTGSIVDIQYLEYASGNEVTVRDNLNLGTNTVTGSIVNIAPRLLDGSIDLSAQYDVDPDVYLMSVDSTIYPAGVTLKGFYLDCMASDPTTEIDGDLKYCDSRGTGAFPGANAVTITACDTTTGNFGVALNTSVAATKEIYLTLGADPADLTTEWKLRLYFTRN